MAMAKSYTDELAAWVETRVKKRKRQQDAAAVAFLAVRVDVSAAIDAGYALTTIWEHMHETGKVKCGYETFRKHVRRFITAAAHRVVKQVSQPQPKARAPAGVGGFSFNATPKKEELI